MDPDLDPRGSWVQVLINPAHTTHRDRNEEVETLIHELSHILLPTTRERDILTIERLMARRITRDQRAILRAFIPRHQVKRYPRVPVTGIIAMA